MCLGIPGKIITLNKKKARIKQAKHYHWVDTSLIEEKLNIGDYLLSYQKAAINKVPKPEAEEILNLIKNNQ